MKNKAVYLIFATTLLFTIVIISMSEVHAQESLFWADNAYSATGVAISTPTLVSGTEYRIVASTIFWYNYSSDLQADAQYYTTTSSGYNWTNYYPAPNGHSFLLIDGSDVNWGPFSNGDTNHQYSITYVGKGLPITFQVYDWVDQDISNNNCHIEISIYQVQLDPTPTPTPTPTVTPLPTLSPSPTPPSSPTPSPTSSPTATPSPTPSPTPIASSTPSSSLNPTATPKPALTTPPIISPTPSPIPTTISSSTATPTTLPLPLSMTIQPILSMTIAYLVVLAIYVLDIVLILIILSILLTEKIRKKQNLT